MARADARDGRSWLARRTLPAGAGGPRLPGPWFCHSLEESASPCLALDPCECKAPTGPAQPPATAGITEILVPSGVAVASPSRNRTSSLPTYTFTKRRGSPAYIRLSALVQDPRLDAGVAAVEVVEDRAEGVALGGHLGGAAGVGAQDRGDADV